MTDQSPEKLLEYLEQVSQVHAELWRAQAAYCDDLVRRNTKVFADLADARIAAFNGMRDAKTFNQAFEANIAFEEQLREEIARLHEANNKAWHELDETLRRITNRGNQEPGPAEHAT